jgi:hypothetical protein
MIVINLSLGVLNQISALALKQLLDRRKRPASCWWLRWNPTTAQCCQAVCRALSRGAFQGFFPGQLL